MIITISLSLFCFVLDAIIKNDEIESFLGVSDYGALGNLFLGFTAIMGFYDLSEKIKDSRTKVIEEQEDLEIWGKVNHSNADIAVSTLVSREMRKALKRYKNRISFVNWITEIDESNASWNYKLSPWFRKTSLLLRVHVRLNEEQFVETLLKTQAYLEESEVFQDSPVKSSFIPFVNRDEKSFSSLKYSGREHLIVLAPFAKGVSHYNSSVKEFISFAKKFGEVQSLIASISTDRWNELNQLSNKLPGLTGDFHSLGKVWEQCKYSFQVQKSKYQTNEILDLFEDQATRLSKIWDDIEKFHQDTKSEKMRPVLHDIHPHNAFFKDGKCVLIYDFEAISTSYQEAESVAFSLFRFARELIRCDFGKKDLGSKIERLSRLFLSNYVEFRKEEPEFIKGNLRFFIQRSNFTKAIYLFHSFFFPEVDLADRDKRIKAYELKKFIVFLKEAEMFPIEIN